MSSLYTTTARIHELLPQINQKYGLKIEVTGAYVITFNDEILHKYQIPFDEKGHCELIDFEIAIQAPQIRQILFGLKEVLGEDENNPFNSYIHNGQSFNTLISSAKNYGSPFSAKELDEFKAFSDKFESKAEAICQKWLDGLNPLFDREPETVLQELVEILQNLLK